MKDSRQINTRDRKKILNTIQRSRARYYIITHGTYTMPATARFLLKHLSNTRKTVIFTGSMIPLDGFTFSDGPFNLAFALAHLQFVDPGVYVAANGRIFRGDKVKKIVAKGRFASLYSRG